MTGIKKETDFWIATEATVTSCRYRSPTLGLLAFGFQTTDKYHITFDYYAHGRLHSGDFDSPRAIPQNERFPISYNPLRPEQNSRERERRAISNIARAPLLAFGAAGSILLSLGWLALLRSCR